MVLLQPLTQLPSSSLPPKPFASDHSLSLFSSHFPKIRTSRNPRILRFTVRSSNSDAQTKTLLPRTAIQRIAEKLRSLGFTDEDPNPSPRLSSSSSAGEIFVPLPSQLPRRRVGHTIDASWSSPENPVPEPGTGTAIRRFRELKREVRKEKREFSASVAAAEAREEKVPTLAELTLPAKEVRRLTSLGIELRKKLKVGKAGITEGIVNGIHERWRRSEVVKIECEDISRINMKRTHDLLEVISEL